MNNTLFPSHDQFLFLTTLFSARARLFEHFPRKSYRALYITPERIYNFHSTTYPNLGGLQVISVIFLCIPHATCSSSTEFDHRTNFRRRNKLKSVSPSSASVISRACVSTSSRRDAGRRTPVTAEGTWHEDARRRDAADSWSRAMNSDNSSSWCWSWSRSRRVSTKRRGKRKFSTVFRSLHIFLFGGKRSCKLFKFLYCKTTVKPFTSRITLCGRSFNVFFVVVVGSYRWGHFLFFYYYIYSRCSSHTQTFGYREWMYRSPLKFIILRYSFAFSISRFA